MCIDHTALADLPRWKPLKRGAFLFSQNQHSFRWSLVAKLGDFGFARRKPQIQGGRSPLSVGVHIPTPSHPQI